MRITGITANVHVADIAAASEFYRDYLGLREEPLGLDWVTRFVGPDGQALVQLVAGDASAPVDSVMSVHAGADIDEAYADAQQRGYEIVYPLTTEPWGIRRFFVRDPDGNVLNITSHASE